MDSGVADGTKVAVGVTCTGLANVGSIGVKVVGGCDIAETTVGEGLAGSTTCVSNGWQANRKPTWVSMSSALLEKVLVKKLLVGMSIYCIDHRDAKETLSYRSKCSTAGVDCNNMCYMFKPSKIAKFSRIFDDSSLQRV